MSRRLVVATVWLHMLLLCASPGNAKAGARYLFGLRMSGNGCGAITAAALSPIDSSPHPLSALDAGCAAASNTSVLLGRTVFHRPGRVLRMVTTTSLASRAQSLTTLQPPLNFALRSAVSVPLDPNLRVACVAAADSVLTPLYAVVGNGTGFAVASMTAATGQHTVIAALPDVSRVLVGMCVFDAATSKLHVIGLLTSGSPMLFTVNVNSGSLTSVSLSPDAVKSIRSRTLHVADIGINFVRLLAVAQQKVLAIDPSTGQTNDVAEAASMFANATAQQAMRVNLFQSVYDAAAKTIVYAATRPGSTSLLRAVRTAPTAGNATEVAVTSTPLIATGANANP